MRKVGYMLIIIALTTISFLYIERIGVKQKETKQVNEYIDVTSKEEIDENNEEEVVKKETSETGSIDYTAVLEIPSINLKKGVVDNTKNFNSIRYAISVDNSSSYPNHYGNFIMYAHSGNSNMSFFRNLNKVNINDSVYVYYNGIKYLYKVIDKHDIEKTGKAVVKSTTSEKYITLITCNQERKGYQVVVEGILVEETNY